MTTVVIPFRSGGKSRLPAELRVEIALAMLTGVLEAAGAAAERVLLVTDDEAAALLAVERGAGVVEDPGAGQGAAVEAALSGVDGSCLVVNADLPGAGPSDLGTLARIAADGAFAIVAADDGTTNALGLPFAAAFAPLYGPGSAERFRANAIAHGLEVRELDLPGLVRDVDTVADLEQIELSS